MSRINSGYLFSASLYGTALILCYLIIITDPDEEISDLQYQTMLLVKGRNVPELNALINESMEDNIITEREYDSVITKSNELSAQEIKEKLKL